MKKQIAVLILGLMSWTMAYAICPICTVAVGVGVGISRWLGIDDTITGLWIGGMTVSVILWTIFWMDKKKFHFTGRNFLTVIIYYVIVLFPLKRGHFFWNAGNILWGMDKLLLGLVLGSLLFAIGSGGYFLLKKRNANRAYFPFQKVVMPIAPLVIASIFFYFVTRHVL